MGENPKAIEGIFRNTRPDFPILLFIMTATLIVYWQVGGHEFVDFDDHLYVVENVHVRNGLTREGIVWAFTQFHDGNWHPLTWISHMLDVWLYGLDSGMHLRVNVLLHTINTLLLFLVFKRMTGEVWRSGFVAAMFALHPFHVESVAWVSERKDLLSTLFGVLAIRGYCLYVERPSAFGYLLVVLFFLCSLMSKPMLVTLPFLLLLLDYWPLNRLGHGLHGSDSPGGRPLNPGMEETTPASRIILEKVPLLLIAVIISAVTYLAVSRQDIPHFVHPTGLRVANALVSYAVYMVKTLWPFDLGMFYPFPGQMHPGKIAGAFILVGGMSVLTAITLRKHPYVTTGWLWFLGTLVPVIGLVPQGAQAMADRYTYIPLTGLFILIAWGLPDLLAGWRFKKIGVGLAGVFLVCILAPVSRVQVGYWQNSHTLFTHTIRATDGNYIVRNTLGFVLEREGRLDEAIAQYYKALEIYPDFVKAHLNLGSALAKAGKYEEAIRHSLLAARLHPDYAPLAYNNVACALVLQNRFEDAIDYLLKALEIDPANPEVLKNLDLFRSKRSGGSAGG